MRAGPGITRTQTVVRNPRQIAILGVIMESIRPSPSDCRERGNVRKDCSKLSASLVGCERCKTQGTSDTGKLECALNRPGGRDHWRRGGASPGDRKRQRSVAAHAPRNPETRERMPITEYLEVQFPGPIVPHRHWSARCLKPKTSSHSARAPSLERW